MDARYAAVNHQHFNQLHQQQVHHQPRHLSQQQQKLSRKRRLSFSTERLFERSTSAPVMMGVAGRPAIQDVASVHHTTNTAKLLGHSDPDTSALDMYPDSPRSVLSFEEHQQDEASLERPGEDDDQEEEEVVVDEPVPKVPRYVGTIYEERLAPLSPVTSLPVPFYLGRGRNSAANNNNSSVVTTSQPADKQLQAKLIDLVNSGNEAALDSFLESHGGRVDINGYGEDGVTPVQRVCQEGGRVGLARVLVKYGADLSLTSRDGWAPLHMAAFSGNLQLIMFIRSCPK